MKFYMAVSPEHSFGRTNKSLNIGIDVDTNIDVNTIASIYVVVKIYTNNIISISILTGSSNIAGTTTTMAITNPELKYASKKYSLYKLQELESQMINAYSSGLSQRVSLEIEVYITDYSDPSPNQDTYNELITLR